MARKKKPYMVFETKEDFDKLWNDVVEKQTIHARAQGFKDGSIWVLSYVQELFQDMFNPEAFTLAEEEIRHRNIEEWQKTHVMETLKYKLDKKHLFDEDHA